MKAIFNNPDINWSELKQKHLDFCLNDIDLPNKLANVLIPKENKPPITDPLGIIPILQENLEDIIIGDINRLNKLEKILQQLLGNNKPLKKSLAKVFSHNTFVKRSAESWGAFSFFKTLGVVACPYCNRQYINTSKRRYRLNKKEIVDKFDIDTYNKVKKQAPNLKPDLDHFFDKGEHPYFGLSLFNFIPSCTICNSRLKHTKNWGILYPYTESFDDYYRFTINFERPKDIIKREGIDKKKVEQYFGTALLNNKTEAFKINLVPKNGKVSKKAFLTKELFFIEELYQNHKDYVLEILKKAQLYNEDYMDSLHDSFPDIFSSQEDFLQAYLANYINEEDINKRPLSKLTIDIAKEFGIIK